MEFIGSCIFKTLGDGIRNTSKCMNFFTNSLDKDVRKINMIHLSPFVIIDVILKGVVGVECWNCWGNSPLLQLDWKGR